MNKPRPESSEPRCIVIAGPNGAGKTTFARDFLTKEAGVVKFINADLIATGLSPLKPDEAAVAAGRVFLSELDRLTRAHESFAFESTLAGVGYAERLRKMKQAGYLIEIAYLKIATPQLALRRIAARVKQGGHNVPRADVLRRFDRSWKTSWRFTGHWRTSGLCSITPAQRLICWSEDRESQAKA